MILKAVSHQIFKSWSMWSVKMFLIDWFIRPILQITLQVDKTKKRSAISLLLKKTNILVDMKCSAFFWKESIRTSLIISYFSTLYFTEIPFWPYQVYIQCSMRQLGGFTRPPRTHFRWTGPPILHNCAFFLSPSSFHLATAIAVGPFHYNSALSSSRRAPRKLLWVLVWV